MKKATLTNNQIEILKYNLEIAIKYHDDNETITAKLKEIDSFLKMAFDLHIIDDYSDITKIMKTIGDAGIQALNKKNIA